jgi:hypothetical protein
MSHLQQDTGNASARTSNFVFPESSVCCTTDKIIGTTKSDSHRPRRAIIPTAKLTDASNSSKPTLKSHQAATDAQRAAEAQKAAELKAIQQAAEEVNTQDSTASAALAGPVDPSEITQSQSSSQLLPSCSQTSWAQSAPSNDDLEEIVGRAKGKRKAISTRPNLKFTLVNH